MLQFQPIRKFPQQSFRLQEPHNRKSQIISPIPQIHPNSHLKGVISVLIFQRAPNQARLQLGLELDPQKNTTFYTSKILLRITKQASMEKEKKKRSIPIISTTIGKKSRERKRRSSPLLVSGSSTRKNS